MLFPRVFLNFIALCAILSAALSGVPTAAAQTSNKSDSKKKSGSAGNSGNTNNMTFQPGSKVPEGHDKQLAEKAAAEKAAADKAASDKASATPAEPKPVALVIDDSVSKLLETFFVLLSKGNVDPAYEALIMDTVIASKKSDVDTLKQKTNQAIELFGNIQGYEIVSTEKVGTRLARVTCLSLGERFPLRWRFYFYESGARWRLIDIRVDDRLMDLFGERAEPGNGNGETR